MQKNITSITETSRVSSAVIAGTTPVTISSVDMTGKLSCTFLVAIGSSNGAGNTVTIEHSSDDTNWTATEFVANLDAAADTVGMVEVDHPLKRYVRAVITRTSSAVVDGVFALQSRSYKDPSTRPTGTTTDYALAPADA